MRQVHDMFSAIQVDDALYSVKLIVKEYNDGHRDIDFKDIRRVHDYYLAKKVAAPSGETGPGAASSARETLPPTSKIANWSAIADNVILKDLISGVKDYRGDNYLQQDSRNNSTRGSVTFTDSGPIIRFFQSHDASTAIHELSHVWLEELRSDAMRPNAPQQLRDDWAEVQRYLQLGELANDAAIPTDAHETFARTGEAYFREGRAPSLQLVGILNQFRDWLRAIYRSLRQLDVEMTPEIRGVFDRLLASDEEIKTMRSPRGKGIPAPLRPPAEDAELR